MRDVTAWAERLELAEAADVAANVVADGGRVAWDGRGVLLDAGAGVPITRGYGLGWDGPVDAERVARWAAFYQDHGLPARIEACPYAQDSLVPALSDAGFVVRDMREVFVRPLSRSDRFDAVQGVQVAPALGDPGPVAELLSRGFGDGEADPDAVRLFRFLIGGANNTAFVAHVGGRPVGAAVVGVREPAAILFAASTLPAFRRRGVQTALIRARLAHARNAGIEAATIQASPRSATRGNAERHGFALLYARLTCVLDKS